MKIVKLSLLSLAALFSVIIAQAQTADEIIARHIEAIGGKEKLKGINSLRSESVMDIMGNSVRSVTTVLNGKGFRNESEFGGQKIIQVFTDKSGWAVNPMMGSADPQPMPEEQYQAGREQIFINPLIDYNTRGGKAELLGKEKVGSVDAYKITLTDKNNGLSTYFIDPTTYYIIQAVKPTEGMGGPTNVTIKFADHKKSDFGMVYPTTMEIDLGGQLSMTAKVEKVEVNVLVDASIFDMKK